jgi:hypothetical protein
MLIVNRYWKTPANYIHALISIARKTDISQLEQKPASILSYKYIAK